MPKATLTYDSVEEANNRLAGTIVTYEDRPVRISEIVSHADGILRVIFNEFPYNGAPVRRMINSPGFKRFRTPPLGYCNYFDRDQSHALWCERVSARSRRQGLCEEVFNAVSEFGGRAGFRQLSSSEAFREMVVGEYPSFDAVMGRLVPDSTIAVDRDFAVQAGTHGFRYLMYRRDTVALIVRESILLRNDRQHLLETIAECPRLPNRVEVL